jgi:rod shape-determining protein MreC
VYDKSVRRRRVALALLVACSLLLLTAYFGESQSGGLHSVQRGVLQVVTPIQEGASRALKPVRDLFGWFGDTINAKSEVSGLRRQNAALRRAAIAGSDAVRQNAELQKLVGLDQANTLQGTRPVAARVIGQSPTIWYSTVNIDVGTGDGVRVGQPVITGDGLVGQVTTATSGAAVVTLITDNSSAVSARVSRSGAPGIVETGAGGPADLRFDLSPRGYTISKGDAIVTAGTTSASNKLESLYPPGIPVGAVTRVDDAGTDTQQVHLEPYADLQRLEIVQVLTNRVNGNRG